MTFYSAVARKDINGYPDEGFQMENSINRGDALIAMTRWELMQILKKMKKEVLKLERMQIL